MMKPVIRVMPMAISGTISGQVFPLDAQATVCTITGSGTISTYLDAEGFFKIMALSAGNYDVEIHPGNTSYRDTVISNVSVSAGQNTNINTVELQNK